MSEKKEEIFRKQSKMIVDMLFDTKRFKDDTTRNDMNAIEDFVCSIMDMQYDSYIMFQNLIEKTNKVKKD